MVIVTGIRTVAATWAAVTMTTTITTMTTTGTGHTTAAIGDPTTAEATADMDTEGTTVTDTGATTKGRTTATEDITITGALMAMATMITTIKKVGIQLTLSKRGYFCWMKMWLYVATILRVVEFIANMPSYLCPGIISTRRKVSW